MVTLHQDIICLNLLPIFSHINAENCQLLILGKDSMVAENKAAQEHRSCRRHSALHHPKLPLLPFWTLCPPFLTFVVKNALHLHAAARVGDAEGPAGDQALGSWGPICGSDQAPVGLVMGPLQHLHGLPTADGQLVAVAGGEVVDHHGQLAPARQL